ncbi:MAG: chemotaxis protein CheA [Algisphaera sp.]
MSLDGIDLEILSDFLTESNELIEKLEEDLVKLEKSAGDDELINSVFRAMHTVKGSASFLALDPVVSIAHVAEDVLNLSRQGEVSITEEVMTHLLESVDVLRSQLDSLNGGEMPQEAPPALVEALKGIASGDKSQEGTASNEQASDASKALSHAGGVALELSSAKLDLVEFMITDLRDQLNEIESLAVILVDSENGADADAEIQLKAKELELTADFFEIDVLVDDVQALAAASAAAPSLDAKFHSAFTLRFATLIEVMRRRAEGLESGVILELPTDTLRERLATLTHGEALPETDLIGDVQGILIHDGVLEGDRSEEAAKPELTTEAPEAKTTEPVVESKKDAKASKSSKPTAPATEATIRVDVNRLESLLNLVGELVLEKNRVLGLARSYRSLPSGNDSGFNDQLEQVSSALDRVTGDLQMSIMKTRMQPMDKLFGRYPRVMRDLAKATGKKINLNFVGGDTEVDKSVIEMLADPMVHLLRNCADHGLEGPEGRIEAGKPEAGEVTVSAYHEGNHVVVEIIDDGRGIDPQKVGQKAVEKGLISSEELAVMPDQNLVRLVFAPGFSTAEAVSNLSGRGVGMDVVNNNITKLGGVIDITSVVGEGTTVSFRIPLTLAIMQAMMAEVGDAVYAIPLTNIVEIVQPEEDALATVRGRNVLRLRDEIIPLVDLSQRLDGVTQDEPLPNAVVVGLGDRRAALQVNELIGQQEIVIKPLDPMFKNSKEVSGATVREDGGVSLILNVASLLESLRTGTKPAA